MTHLFLNAEVCVNMLMIPSLCALTKCLRTNRVLDDCPRVYTRWRKTLEKYCDLQITIYTHQLCKKDTSLNIYTPMSWSIRKEYLFILKFLLASHAQLNIANTNEINRDIHLANSLLIAGQLGPWTARPVQDNSARK